MNKTAMPTSTRRSGRRMEGDPRFAHFREEYLRTGNAYQAALKAGYTHWTAKAKSYRMAQRVRAELEQRRPITERPTKATRDQAERQPTSIRPSDVQKPRVKFLPVGKLRRLWLRRTRTTD